jgi:DNA-binding winged helix-turn-helix (wHTH) protein
MVYEFGDCLLDTQRYTLHRAEQTIALRPKVFQLLLFLLEHREHVVSKQELCEQVWPHQYISPATLESTLREVRRVIGDSGRAQQMIQTQYGFGYRFVAPVTVRPDGMSEREAQPAPAPARLDTDPTRLSPGERKLVTLLCCGLGDVPQADMPQELDTLHARMREVSGLAQQEVHRYGGTMQAVTGAHLLAIFGAPVAQEDHAVRAVLAALGLHQRFEAQRSRDGASSGASRLVRTGVHTGMVAWEGLGPSPQMSTAVVGDTTRLADCLVDHAVPGTLVCCAATAHLVQQVVRLSEMPPVSVPGRATPIRAYQVLGSVPQRTPAVQRGPRTRGVFVGRAQELATLHARLAQVEHGQGQVVGIVGEAGIGKSRLVAEFRRSLQGRRLTYLTGHGVSLLWPGDALPAAACPRAAQLWDYGYRQPRGHHGQSAPESAGGGPGARHLGIVSPAAAGRPGGDGSGT